MEQSTYIEETLLTIYRCINTIRDIEKDNDLRGFSGVAIRDSQEYMHKLLSLGLEMEKAIAENLKY